MKQWLIACLAVTVLPAWAAVMCNVAHRKRAVAWPVMAQREKAAVPLYPDLAGQHAPYLEHALQAYKKGERSGGQAEVMKAFVAGLSDSDMADLAAYYGSLQP